MQTKQVIIRNIYRYTSLYICMQEMLKNEEVSNLKRKKQGIWEDLYGVKVVIKLQPSKLERNLSFPEHVLHNFAYNI